MVGLLKHCVVWRTHCTLLTGRLVPWFYPRLAGSSVKVPLVKTNSDDMFKEATGNRVEGVVHQWEHVGLRYYIPGTRLLYLPAAAAGLT